MQHQIKITIICILAGLFWGNAQDKIGTETVTVTNAYKPTISDAFKIKSAPNFNDSIVLKKKNIKYSIFSVPVASTFTPAKGKASTVKKIPPPKIFNSYASVGLGNFNNALVDFYTSRDINRGDERLDIGFNHHSSSGSIDGVAVDNVFYNSKLTGAFTKRDRDFDWGVQLGLQHQLYNWYGIPVGTFDEAIFNTIDERQNYFNAELGAHLNLEDSFFKNGKLLIRRFWDVTGGGENRVVLAPPIELPIADELVTVKTKVDYVGGSFENANVNNEINSPEINYSHVQFGITPSLVILRDDLTLNLGASLVYGLDAENSDSSFFIYPSVTASYRLVDETVIAYGGIKGELVQNSYHDFVDENPYVSNIKGSYTAENRKPLFKLNPTNSFRNDEKGYFYGNSFEIFYDDVKTLGIFGELNVDVNRNFTFGINAEVYDYDTETDNPAWNLPNLTGSLFMDYQIGEQWFLGANLFFVGEREDISSQVVQNTIPADFPATLVTLDSYFDANAHIGYRFNEQLSIFGKVNNIANNNYQRWANYPVQGFQVLAGATYKFDF